MIKILYAFITLLLLYSYSYAGEVRAFKIYSSDKEHKVQKYRLKLQKHYNDTHIAGTPHIIAVPVTMWNGKRAVPLCSDTPPDNDEDEGNVFSIDPPKPEQ